MTEISSKIIENFVELEYLTDSEKKKLELVLNRNEKLNKKENARLRKLSTTETELNFLENSQDFKQSTKSLNSCKEYGNSLSDLLQENFSKKSNNLEINLIGNCNSCGRRFSFLPWSCASPNSNSCSICKSKMCKKCTHHMDRPNIEICKACHKNILFEAKSGKWFYNNSDSDQNSMDGFRSASVIGNDRWIPVEKLASCKKEFGSADHLENTGISQNSISTRHLIPKRKFNNSAYFRIESPNRINLSPETTENTSSPFRRINKNLKSNYLNTSNYFDTTLKSEDSGCALDMDDETASESALKISSSTQFGSNSKCYFKPLQILSQNSNNNNLSDESNDNMPFSQIRTNPLISNSPYNGTISISKHVGEILLSLLYDDNSLTVNVTVHKCRNLVSVDPLMNCINPYIILFVRPNRLKQGKQKTRTQFSTNNPIFEEYFMINFDIGEGDLSQSLILLLCHKNEKTGKDLAIGQLSLTADEIVHSDQLNHWFVFQRMNSTKVSSPDHRSVISRQSDVSLRYRSNTSIAPSLSDCISPSNNDFINSDYTVTGEISIALKFVTSPSMSSIKNCNELHLWVKSAKILDIESSSSDSVKIMYPQSQLLETNQQTSSKFTKRKSSRSNTWLNDLFGYQDVVAKSHLFTNHGVHSKEISATKFLENEGHYIWSSIMKFETDLPEIKNATLEISLWIHSNNAIFNKLLPSRCIGSVYLGLNNDLQKSGSNRSQNENRLWQAMLSKHNIWIDETLVLKNRKDRI